MITEESVTIDLIPVFDRDSIPDSAITGYDDDGVALIDAEYYESFIEGER